MCLSVKVDVLLHLRNPLLQEGRTQKETGSGAPWKGGFQVGEGKITHQCAVQRQVLKQPLQGPSAELRKLWVQKRFVEPPVAVLLDGEGASSLRATKVCTVKSKEILNRSSS